MTENDIEDGGPQLCEWQECDNLADGRTGRSEPAIRDNYCSDRCYFFDHGGVVPFGKSELGAYSRAMFPKLREGQIMPRPGWHGWVYGGAVRPKPGSPEWKGERG